MKRIWPFPNVQLAVKSNFSAKIKTNGRNIYSVYGIYVYVYSKKHTQHEAVASQQIQTTRRLSVDI